MKPKILSVFILPIAFCILLIACSGEEPFFTPKPKGYMRIDFPEKKYKLYDSTCPFTFETPEYSIVQADVDRNSLPCWLNIRYVPFKAQLHISYLPINATNKLDTLLMTSHELAVKHEVRASGMDQNVVIRDSAHVFGLVYEIAGNTASSLQFHLTDSTHHFFRGSLYFDVAPNIDSTQIVVDFLKEDIMHMIQTFQWKDAGKISVKK